MIGKLTLIKSLKTKPINYIYHIKSNISLFIEYIRQTDYTDYQVWCTRDDKKLDIVFIEWVINTPLRYLGLGLLMTVSYITPGFIGLVFKASVCYWLLERFIKLVKRGE